MRIHWACLHCKPLDVDPCTSSGQLGPDRIHDRLNSRLAICLHRDVDVPQLSKPTRDRHGGIHTEGHAFADSEFGNRPRKADHANVASAVFSQPPIASVGLSEADAINAHGKVTIFESQFRAMKNTISGRGEKTYMKLIVDAANDKVVGVHMMGPDCGEIMQGIAIAVKMGATKADFDATIGIHPTAAEEFVTMRTPRKDG